MKILCKLAIVATILLCAVPGQAADLDLGLKSGIDYIGLPHSRDTDAPRGFTAGFYLEQPLSKIHAFRFEFNYAYREFQTYRDYYWLTGDFIDLVALAKIFPPGEYRLTPYLYIGPVITELIQSGWRGLSPPHHYFVPELDRLHISYAIGGGFDFNIMGRGSTIDIRLIRELTESSNILDHKSNYASVTFGVVFSKKRIR